MRTFTAVLLAALTASLYALATSLQALEARQAPKSEALSASLIARLIRRPLWVIGTVAGLLAWPLQAIALSFASVTLVQPTMGFGLVVLLVLGVRVLHESVGPREIAGVLAIAGGVAVLGWAGPSQTGSFTTVGTWVTAVALIVVAPAPYVLRRLGRAGGLPTSVAAGLGWACLGLGTALLDAAVADRHLVVVLAWGAAMRRGGMGSSARRDDLAPDVGGHPCDPGRLRPRDGCPGSAGALPDRAAAAARGCLRGRARPGLRRGDRARKLTGRRPGRRSTYRAVMPALYTPAKWPTTPQTSPRSSRG